MKTLNAFFPLPAVAFAFAGFNWPRRVAILPRGSRADRVRNHTAPVCGPYYCAPSPVAPGGGAFFYLESDFAPGLRMAWCDDIDGTIRHNGWYLTDDGDGDTVRGIVARLPHSRGFLAGWSMGAGMASELSATIYDDESDAAQAADAGAESLAERERDTERDYREAEELAAECAA